MGRLRHARSARSEQLLIRRRTNPHDVLAFQTRRPRSNELQEWWIDIRGCEHDKALTRELAAVAYRGVTRSKPRIVAHGDLDVALHVLPWSLAEAFQLPKPAGNRMLVLEPADMAQQHRSGIRCVSLVGEHDRVRRFHQGRRA